jgi:toxin YoeB
MAKKIVWSRKAQNDRKEILLYWETRNKSKLYSRKLNFLLNAAAASIANFPKIGKQTGYKYTRIKIVRDYLMVYKEHESMISIIAIWDGRQDPLKFEKIMQ